MPPYLAFSFVFFKVNSEGQTQVLVITRPEMCQLNVPTLSLLCLFRLSILFIYTLCVCVYSCCLAMILTGELIALKASTRFAGLNVGQASSCVSCVILVILSKTSLFPVKRKRSRCGNPKRIPCNLLCIKANIRCQNDKKNTEQF